MFTPVSERQIRDMFDSIPYNTVKELTDKHDVMGNLLGIVAKKQKEGMTLGAAYSYARESLFVTWMPTYMRVILSFERQAARFATV